MRRRHHGAQRCFDRTLWVGQEVGDAGERLVWLGIEDMQDRADEKAVAGLLPMIAAIERPFRIDQDVGDVLDVAHFLVAASHLQQRIVSRGRCVGRIEFEDAAEPEPETSRQRPVLSLDVVNDAASGPGQQRRDHQADAFTRSCRCKA